MQPHLSITRRWWWYSNCFTSSSRKKQRIGRSEWCKCTSSVLNVQGENVVQGDPRTSPWELWCVDKTKETNRWSTSTSRQQGHGSGYEQRQTTNWTGFSNVAGFLNITFLYFHHISHMPICQFITSLYTAHSARNLGFIFFGTSHFSDEISALSKASYSHIPVSYTHLTLPTIYSV